jgi:RHS repeat-associated protein
MGGAMVFAEKVTFSTVCFGVCRNSTDTSGTNKLFTGQRLDTTGLYYYNARYYDPTIGRFISADTMVPNPANPQSFNRYSYCLNNPLKYNDPTGHYGEDGPPPTTDGTYGWSETDGMWLIAFNGQWMPMNPESPQIAPKEPEPAVPWVAIAGYAPAIPAFPGGFSIPTALRVIGSAVFSLAGAAFTMIFGLMFIKGDTNKEFKKYYDHQEWVKHQEDLEAARNRVSELEVELSKSKSPKERVEIQKKIDEENEDIKGHEKEIRQKWPGGEPEG